jgi:hypothetical protein
VEIYRNVADVEDIKVVCWNEYVLSYTIEYSAAYVEVSGVKYIA